MPARYFWFIIGITLLSVISHILWQVQLFSFMPWFIIWPTVVSWTHPRPWLLIFLASQLMELATRLPIGVMTMIVFIPYLVALVWRRTVSVDLSYTFAAVLLFSSALQLVVAIVSSLSGIAHLVAPFDLLQSIPWLLLASVSIASTVVTYTLCIIWREFIAVSL